MGELCLKTEAKCYCIKSKGHKGFCECRCGGSWSYENGIFKIGSLPSGFWPNFEEDEKNLTPQT